MTSTPTSPSDQSSEPEQPTSAGSSQLLTTITEPDLPCAWCGVTVPDVLTEQRDLDGRPQWRPREGAATETVTAAARWRPADAPPVRSHQSPEVTLACCEQCAAIDTAASASADRLGIRDAGARRRHSALWHALDRLRPSPLPARVDPAEQTTPETLAAIAAMLPDRATLADLAPLADTTGWAAYRSRFAPYSQPGASTAKASRAPWAHAEEPDPRDPDPATGAPRAPLARVRAAQVGILTARVALRQLPAASTTTTTTDAARLVPVPAPTSPGTTGEGAALLPPDHPLAYAVRRGRAASQRTPIAVLGGCLLCGTRSTYLPAERARAALRADPGADVPTARTRGDITARLQDAAWHPHTADLRTLGGVPLRVLSRLGLHQRRAAGYLCTACHGAAMADPDAAQVGGIVGRRAAEVALVAHVLGGDLGRARRALGTRVLRGPVAWAPLAAVRAQQQHSTETGTSLLDKTPNPFRADRSGTPNAAPWDHIARSYRDRLADEFDAPQAAEARQRLEAAEARTAARDVIALLPDEVADAVRDTLGAGAGR